MARLTKERREAFVAAVGRKLPPLPDFDWQAEFASPVRRAAESVLPAEVRAFAEKYPRFVDRTVANLKYLSEEEKALFDSRAPYQLQTTYIADAENPEQKAARDEAAFAHFDSWKQRKQERRALLARVRAVADFCTTDEKLREVFPEFADLIPAPVAAPRDLPVAAGNALVADLVRAGLRLTA